MAAPSRSCCSKWKAMRWADLGPTPGRRRSASVKNSKDFAMRSGLLEGAQEIGSFGGHEFGNRVAGGTRFIERVQLNYRFDIGPAVRRGKDDAARARHQASRH